MNEILGLLILIALPILSVYALIGIIELITTPFKAATTPKATLAPQPLTVEDMMDYWLICDQNRVKLELAEARLKKVRLAVKRIQRGSNFYEETSFNPSTGLPMLTDTMDIGGNDCSCVGGI